MVPHRLTWGFAFNFPFALVIGVVTIVAWLISKEPKKLPKHPISYLLILLAVWISLSTVLAVLPDAAHWKWDRSIKILVMTFLLIILMQSRERIDALIWVIVLSIGFYAVKGGIFILRGESGLVWGPPGGFFEDNNALALTIVMVVPLMRYLQLQATKWWIRYGLGLSMLLSAAAVIGTYSRGAMLAGLTMVGLLVLRSRHRFVFGAIAVFLLVVSVPFLPEEWIERMQSIQDFQQDGSAMGRIDAWSFAFRYALDHPVFGGGFFINRADELFMSYVPEAVKSRAFHSVYFEVLGEHGFAGLGIFLTLGVTAFLSAGGIRRYCSGKEELNWARDLAGMAQVSIVGYAVGGAFLSLAFYDLYYNIVGIVLLTRIVVRKGEQAELRQDLHMKNAYGAGQSFTATKSES